MDSSGFMTALANQLARHGDGHAASGFGKDSFGFSEQADAFDDFVIAHIFARAAARKNCLGRINTVGGVADGERFGNGVGFLRVNFRGSALGGAGDG